MKHEELRPCDICRGVGRTPVKCVGTMSEELGGRKVYWAPPDADPCKKCGGEGERLVVVSDERDQRDEVWSFREEAWDRAEFIRVQEMWR